MTNIIDSIWRTISSPFAPFFRTPNTTTYNNSPQNLGVRAIQPRPIAPPPKTMTTKQQLQALNPQIYDTKWLESMTDQEAVGRLKIEQEARQKQAIKAQEKSIDVQKYNQGQAEIAQKDLQRHQFEIQSYENEQNRRAANASVVQQKHDAETQPYVSWLYQQQASRNNQYAPIPPIKFG